ncbi:MAG: hypothetical protein OEN22_02095, partial [Gammaproteobacteria bacterium]|nr:hypothetical protein [Gammaproteobacteria bacterium]
TETVVWINQHHKGLPAFYQDVGYVFDGAGLLDRRPGSDEPLVLGNPAPDSAFPADIEPRLSQAETVMIIGNIRRGKVLTGC